METTQRERPKRRLQRVLMDPRFLNVPHARGCSYAFLRYELQGSPGELPVTEPESQ